MNKWKVNIKTHSRDDVMKVCALLAKGIGTDAVTAKRSLICVFGNVSSGKSAIIDGMSAAFSDSIVFINYLKHL